jgi:hypothetical protein
VNKLIQPRVEVGVVSIHLLKEQGQGRRGGVCKAYKDYYTTVSTDSVVRRAEKFAASAGWGHMFQEKFLTMQGVA